MFDRHKLKTRPAARWRHGMLAALLVLSACGGGGEQQAGVSSGGTGSFSDGSITEMGSIVVNGVHFDQMTASRVVNADGVTLAREDLDPGMRVEIEAGNIVMSGSRQEAATQTIRVSSDLLGVVNKVGTGTLEVMGQVVRITPQTFVRKKVDGRWQDMDLSEIAEKDVVEVYGFHDTGNDADPGNDVYIATRIEKRRPEEVTAYSVRGVISDLTTTGCRIGQQRIDIQWSTQPGVRNGRVARAILNPDPDVAIGMRWYAQRMSLTTPLATDRSDARVSGLVTEWASDTSFSVNGVPVDAAAAPCAACRPGAWVAVRGSLVNAVLRAESLDIGHFTQAAH